MTLTKLTSLASEAKKAVVGLVGFAALLIATGVLTGNVLHIAQGLVALGTVLGIYRAENADPVPSEADGTAAAA
jgi:hypothetical protein